jgi:hypothetical protein
MKKSRPSSNQLPAWQMERANKLQRACERIRAAVASGQPIQKTILCVARGLNGRPYRCAASRRLALSPTTLRRLWDVWRRGGEVSAAFKLNYDPQPSALTAPVLERFANFISSQPQRSLRAAWQVFCRRGGALGHGPKKKNLPQVTYDMLRHNFGAANFYRLQGALKAIHAAELNLARERLAIIAAIRARLPERPAKRRRAKREIMFEI